MSLEARARAQWPTLLAIVVAGGVLLRIAAILVAEHLGHGPVRGDAITYDGLAQSLSAGEGYVHHGRTDNARAPAYPFVLSLVYRAVGHRPLAGAIAQALWDGLAIAILAVLTRWLTMSAASALLASAMLALWPGAMLMDLTLYTEPFYTVVLLLGTFALMRMETEPAPRRAIAAGVLWGIAGLTRQNALFFLPMYAVAGPFVFRSMERRRMGARILALVVALLVLTPWCVRDVVVNGRLTWIQDYSGLNLWIGNHLPYEGRAIDRAALAEITDRLGPRADDQVVLNQELRREAVRSMREHPRATAWLWVEKAERFLFVDLRPHHLGIRLLLSLGLLLGYVAAYFGARSLPHESRAALMVLVAVFAYTLVVHVVSYSQMRFAEPTRPLVIALAAHGLLRPRAPRGHRPDAHSSE
jgi:4-amino-4-deoxy-L-arabinose transferase-like glycosyltransferase